MTGKFRLQWPVDEPVRITQRFGENPQVYAEFGQAGHEGVDFGVSAGSPIYACADGEVFQVRPDDGNDYGLHVRVRHQVDGCEYRTVYAHLSQALVSKNQHIRTGERIALSGNTGHSYGPHLHLTLKLIGAQTPGYPAWVVDPFPYLQEAETPAPSDLTIYPIERLRLRAGPTTASAQLAWLDQGEALTVLGDASAARACVGQTGRWIQVRRADGMDGYAAAWYVQLQPCPSPPEAWPEPTPAEALLVYVTEALNVRRGPSTGTDRVAIALPHEPLTVVGDLQAALAKIGDRGQWIQVHLPAPAIDSGQGGGKGYVAAWYVQKEPGPAPTTVLTVYPTEDMNMRARPTVSANPPVGRPAQGTPLAVHDDPARARALVGRYDEWLYVETPQGQRGWVAAWYVQTEPPRLAEPVSRLALAGPLTVYSTEALNVRSRPSTNTSRVAIALPHEPLTVVGDPQAALSRLRQLDEWLEVRLPEPAAGSGQKGRKGYVAAWYAQTEPGPEPETSLTVYPIRDTKLRERPTVKARRIGRPAHNTPLVVHDDPERARALVGRYDEWLYVETPQGRRGWMAAWYVSQAPT